MKKTLITLAIVLLAVVAQAQIKMHSNGRLTFQTLANTSNQGVSIGPAPDWHVDFNGGVYFHKMTYFINNASDYQWVNAVHVSNPHAAAWVIACPDWDSTNFFVYAKGDVYYRHHFTIGGNTSHAKGGSEPIVGSEALSIINGLNGYYFAPEDLEIPNLDNNEFVVPEAIEAMYADFGKRTAGLSGANLEEVFPESVRTDPKNRLCIDYESIVTMLVEAVKEQQREIEKLRDIVEKIEKTK